MRQDTQRPFFLSISGRMVARKAISSWITTIAIAGGWVTLVFLDPAFGMALRKLFEKARRAFASP